MYLGGSATNKAGGPPPNNDCEPTYEDQSYEQQYEDAQAAYPAEGDAGYEADARAETLPTESNEAPCAESASVGYSARAIYDYDASKFYSLCFRTFRY